MGKRSSYPKISTPKLLALKAAEQIRFRSEDSIPPHLKAYGIGPFEIRRTIDDHRIFILRTTHQKQFSISFAQAMLLLEPCGLKIS